MNDEQKKQPLNIRGCYKEKVKQLYKGELLQRTTLNNSSMQKRSLQQLEASKKLAEKLRQKKVKHNPCSLPCR